MCLDVVGQEYCLSSHAAYLCWLPRDFHSGRQDQTTAGPRCVRNLDRCCREVVNATVGPLAAVTPPDPGALVAPKVLAGPIAPVAPDEPVPPPPPPGVTVMRLPDLIIVPVGRVTTSWPPSRFSLTIHKTPPRTRMPRNNSDQRDQKEEEEVTPLTRGWLARAIAHPPSLQRRGSTRLDPDRPGPP